jgi:peptidoglycan pentaglycine glycine transferase (the fourth and fifth glycine)
MESDKRLLAYKNDVLEATEGSKTIGKKYIAGALVVKYNNRVDIIMSGFDPKCKRFNANYYLHNAIINYYKDSYEILDLNGLTGDFTDKNPYSGLNNFKLGFNPKIYELIGEYDLLLKPMAYRKLYNNGTLAKVLNKTDEKELIQFN